MKRREKQNQNQTNMRLLLAETRSMYWQSAWSRSRSKLGEMGDRVRADTSQTSISRVLSWSSHGPTDQRQGAQSATSPCAGIPQRIPPLGAPRGPGQARRVSPAGDPSLAEGVSFAPRAPLQPGAALGCRLGHREPRRSSLHAWQLAQAVVSWEPPQAGCAWLRTPAPAPWGAVTPAEPDGWWGNTCCPSALCRRSEG